jgi:hypothetical protein
VSAVEATSISPSVCWRCRSIAMPRGRCSSSCRRPRPRPSSARAAWSRRRADRDSGPPKRPKIRSSAFGTRVTTAPIPVLAVTQVQCIEGARRCTANEAPHGISMMGIGFGRRHDHQAQGAPDKNPFLNITKLNKDGPDVERMRRSYIALTEVIARMPLVLHETRGQPLLAPRSFSREQWSRL